MADVKVKIRVEVDGTEVARQNVKGKVEGRSAAISLADTAKGEIDAIARKLIGDRL